MKKINLFILVFASIVFSNYINDKFKYFADGIMSLILIYLYIFKSNRYYINQYKNNAIFNYILIFMLIISTILNIGNKLAILFTVRIILLIILIFKIFRVYGRSYIEDFFIGLTKIMCILNIISIFELINKTNYTYMYLNPIYISWFSHIGEIGFRISSVFVHPIVYGNLLVITLIALISIKTKVNKFYYYLSIALIMINLYGTKSRSCWISFTVVILILGILRLKKYKLSNIRVVKVVGLLSSMFIIVLMIKDYLMIIIQPIIERFGAIGVESVSTMQRIGAMKNVMSSFNDNILSIFIGNGVKSSSEFMSNNQVILVGFKSIDNQYLTMLYECGVLFIVLYFLYMTVCIRNIFYDKNITSNLILVAIWTNMFFYEALFWREILFFTLLMTINISVNIVDKKKVVTY